jgi:hypothetical protein
MADAAPVQVELDIFSGRPNPQWLFPAAAVRRVVEQVMRSPDSFPAPPVPGLGYRGFIVSNPPGSQLLPATIRVYNGTISLISRKGGGTIQDSVGLEQELIADATRLGFGSVIEQGRGGRSSG